MISIVIPCYNEEDKIYKNIIAVCNYLESVCIYDYEVILCDDGSKDNTVEEIKKALKICLKAKLIECKVNGGKGQAVNEGMLKSTGDYAIFMDADLATDLNAIPKILEELRKFDVVIGSRRAPGANIAVKQPIHRQFIGKTCSIITTLILSLDVKDTQCGFKGFTRKAINDIFNKQTVKGFAFDAELLYISKLNNYMIKEIPIKWSNAETTSVNAIKDSLRFFKTLFVIRKNKKSYYN